MRSLRASRFAIRRSGKKETTGGESRWVDARQDDEASLDRWQAAAGGSSALFTVKSK